MGNKIDYKQPGEGAIEFAQSFTGELTIYEAMPVIKRLMSGELHDTTDKRIKRCNYCGYWWRDDSLRNTKRTCSDDCKRILKTLQRRQQRADKALLNPKPKKETKRETYYIHWLEYPFWLNEYEMLKQSWKYENPYSPKKIEMIDGAKQRSEKMGGKRKPKYTTPYNGDKKEDAIVKSQQVNVRFLHEQQKNYLKPGEVIISYMSPDELSTYYSSKYSERHLRMARMRAEGKF